MIVKSNLNMKYVLKLENELCRVKGMSLGQINNNHFTHNLSPILLKLNQNQFYDLQAEFEKVILNRNLAHIVQSKDSLYTF